MTKTNKLIEQVYKTLNEKVDVFTFTNYNFYNATTTNYVSWTGGPYTLPNPITIDNHTGYLNATTHITVEE